jgi:hypothetical protein
MASCPSDGRPLVIAVGGLPGSGKSTLGRQLAIVLRAALLDLDTLTNPLIAQIAGLTEAADDLDHPSLRGSVRQARYACLRDACADVAGAGVAVVMVAPFTAELRSRSAWAEFSAPLAAGRPLLIDTVVDPGLALRRRIRRGLPRDQQITTGTPVGMAAPDQRSPADRSAADLTADGAADPAREACRLMALVQTYRDAGSPGKPGREI